LNGRHSRRPFILVPAVDHPSWFARQSVLGRRTPYQDYTTRSLDEFQGFRRSLNSQSRVTKAGLGSWIVGVTSGCRDAHRESPLGTETTDNNAEHFGGSREMVDRLELHLANQRPTKEAAALLGKPAKIIKTLNWLKVCKADGDESKSPLSSANSSGSSKTSNNSFDPRADVLAE
jgi:hypothetical protein